MSNASPWDDPELKTGEFYSFDNPGDTASGVIQSIGIHRWDDGKVSPQIKMIDDSGEDRTLTAGQAQLKAKLVELRPNVGDHLRVVYTQSEKRAGGKTLKHFEVVVNGGGVPQAPAPVAAPVAQAPAPTVADPAAALAAAQNLGLTAEQLAAIQGLAAPVAG